MQAMQRKMEAMQAEIDQKEVETTAGGGAVAVTVSGKKLLFESGNFNGVVKAVSWFISKTFEKGNTVETKKVGQQLNNLLNLDLF